MIQVNLLPGAKRRKRKRSTPSAFSRIDLSKFAQVDGWVAFVVAGWVVGPGAGAWMYLGAQSHMDDLNVSIEAAAADSARYAKIIEATKRIRAQRDTIAEKLEVIRGLDADRYIWPHILDEVSRALPDYTWLNRLYPVGDNAGPSAPLGFRIEGYTGTYFGLTRFMENLTNSPFIASTSLESSQLVNETTGDRVYFFVLDAAYEEPSADVLEWERVFVMEDTGGVASD